MLNLYYLPITATSPQKPLTLSNEINIFGTITTSVTETTTQKALTKCCYRLVRFTVDKPVTSLLGTH